MNCVGVACQHQVLAKVTRPHFPVIFPVEVYDLVIMVRTTIVAIIMSQWKLKVR